MGLTVVDAGVIIGFLDAEDTHHDAAHSALREARDRHDDLVLPASAFTEVLVGPSRRGRSAVASVRELLDRAPIAVEPLDAEIAATAARLRSRLRGLKLPDALVIATAEHLDAAHLVTTDRGWPSRSKLGLRAILTEL